MSTVAQPTSATVLPSAIRSFYQQGFDLMNVTSDKRPCDQNGRGLKDWQKLDKAALRALFDPMGSRVSLRLGVQNPLAYVISLDFDIFDRAKNADDPQTAALFARYMAERVSCDGHYTSSTEGNHNVLVNIASSHMIQSALGRAGNKSKYALGHLELLVRGQQVIPPTQTVSKRTGELGPARRFEGEVTMLELKDDDLTVVHDLILKCLDTYIQALERRPVNSQIEFELYEGKDDDKFALLLLNVIGNGYDTQGNKVISWDQAFHIAAMLQTNGYSRDLFLKWSAPQDAMGDAADMWNRARGRQFSIRGLQNIARLVNPTGYREWLEEHQVTNPILGTLIVDKGDLQVAEYMASLLCDRFVYSRLGHWYVCQKASNIWVKRSDVSTEVMKCVVEELEYASGVKQDFAESLVGEVPEEAETQRALKIAEARFKVIKEYSKHMKDLCGPRRVSLMGYLRDHLVVEEADTLFQPQPGKMSFRNGIFDMTAQSFQEGIRKEDYVVVYNDYDFDTPDSSILEEARNEIKKILNNNEEHVSYLLRVLGYSMTGYASRETGFWYLRGQTAANGKSALFDILRAVFPVFVGEIDQKAFDAGEDCGKTIASFGGKRILYVPEMTTAKKQDSILKQIADGRSIEYKRLYTPELQSMPVTFKLFMVSNHSIKIGSDNGVARRFVNCQFNSQFLTGLEEDDPANLRFVRNTRFVELFETVYRDALVQLIMEEGSAYCREGLLPVPEEWVRDAQEAMRGNSACGQWIEDNLEFGPERKLSSALLRSLTENTPFRRCNWIDEFARAQKGVVWNSQERIDRHHADHVRLSGCPKGVFSGVGKKRKSEEELEEEAKDRQEDMQEMCKRARL
jgi:hypothetical protein